jgi:vacuolar protein sorting-associated protein 11
MREDDDGTECPICAPQNATIRAIRKAQEESASRHDLFQDALARSRNKFSTISEWFGRGVMGGGAASE